MPISFAARRTADATSAREPGPSTPTMLFRPWAASLPRFSFELLGFAMHEPAGERRFRDVAACQR